MFQFFFRHSLLNVTKNSAGEVTGFGGGTVFRFEQDPDHGTFDQEIQTNGDGTQFLRLSVDLTLFYISKGFNITLEFLRQGRWAIFVLDYEDKIRLFGEWSPMERSGTLVES